MRYIDDIFFIGIGAKNELDQFFEPLNKKHSSIKFNYKASKDRILFLGTEIYLHNSKLHTKIYRTETDRQHYLHIKCEHPKSLEDFLAFEFSKVVKPWLYQIINTFTKIFRGNWEKN